MPSQQKLIKQGIQYTDSLFDEISKRLEQGVRNSDTLESFLDKYHKAFPDNDNPLIALRYDAEMLKLILSETNNHKFSRPAQKELVRVTIESKVGELIRDVGEDIRDSVRDIVKQGYNENLSQDEIASNISSKVSSIKGRRAKAIARTEIARTATISDYVINKERGATHFYVECRNTACPICKEAWHKHWSKSNDESFNPHETSAGGKGWIGDKVYSMSDTMMLPPVHPNCRCVAYFISEDDIPDGVTVEKPTPKTTTTTTDSQPVENEPYVINARPNSNTDVKITKDALDKVISHQDKYIDHPLEHGNLLNLKTGKLLNRTDDRGTTNQVWVSRPRSSENKRVGVIHNHPGFSGLSGGDLKTQLGYNNQDVIFATTENGIWMARDTREASSKKKMGGVPKQEQDFIKDKAKGKSKEIYHEVYEQKYKTLIENAESKEEVRRLAKEYSKEYSSRYNSWLLEEFGPGKNNLIEVDFIPNERLKYVKF